MASGAAAAVAFPAELEEELNCSICLYMYKNPILLSCGHNFCKDCIGKVWESQAAKGTYSCPECRAQFRERPFLQRNLKLCNVIERLLSTQVMQKQATVYCTFCVETPVLAIKTCLQCETSFCEVHLRKHNKSVDHTLIEPTSCFKGRKCPEHKEVIKFYCTDDGTCVCVACCVAGKHKNHNVETVAEAAEKRQAELTSFHQKLCLQNKEIKDMMQELRERLRSTEKEVFEEKNRVTALYSEIKELLDTAKRGTLDGIDAEGKRIVGKISLQIRKLEKKNADNLFKLQEMKNMKTITDPLIFINESKHMAVSTRGLGNEEQEQDSNDDDDDDDDSSADNSEDDEEENEGITKEDLQQTISLVTETQLNGFIERLFAVKEVKGFTLQKDPDLTFDANTASSSLILSNDLKTAITTKTKKQGFTENRQSSLQLQVFCSQSFSSGCHFWKFKIGKKPYWGLGITYDRIVKKGGSSLLGVKSSSWALICLEGKLCVGNNNKGISIKQETAPQKVGMYLDYEEGILSFYNVTETFRHLYTFNCTFTKPVYPGCFITQDGWIQIL
ncbi:E3 ubiquitin/ISG15 ligase TRIM25-like [Latimeria chalumnae]|uniref:E3 ubiquitin/ISG15 ligase TRIM25-like n=1 Tax=Latimeria chalumnae TaxID=7897 RepID=UPI0003C16E9E